MDIWNSLHGLWKLRLVCADPASAIQTITDSGISVYSAVRDDADITVTFQIRRRDMAKLERLAEKLGIKLEILGHIGIYWKIMSLFRRPVLVIGLLILCFLATYLPSRIFFVRVEGNHSVPTRLILEKCSQCGIGFGASRGDVRSQKMKDALLQSLPQLQWAGINTSGCVATITVRERETEQEPVKPGGVSSIIASRDGIITEVTITSGNGVCRVGQVVRKGDLLVSGFWDCGLHIQSGRAEAEIFAQTQRTLTAVTPSQWTKSEPDGVVYKKYALILGKKRINFYKGSGISSVSCDKMYSETYVTLPGGFVLPISWVTETWTGTTPNDVKLTDDAAQVILSEFSERYLKTQMVAGAILDRWTVTTSQFDLLRLDGNYACTEMIGQAQDEEIVIPNGNDYGTDR